MRSVPLAGPVGLFRGVFGNNLRRTSLHTIPTRCRPYPRSHKGCFPVTCTAPPMWCRPRYRRDRVAVRVRCGAAPTGNSVDPFRAPLFPTPLRSAGAVPCHPARCMPSGKMPPCHPSSRSPRGGPLCCLGIAPLFQCLGTLCPAARTKGWYCRLVTGYLPIQKGIQLNSVLRVVLLIKLLTPPSGNACPSGNCPPARAQRYQFTPGARASAIFSLGGPAAG